MNLIVNKKERVTVDVYAWEKDGVINATLDQIEAPSEAKIVKFIFRKPTYLDSQTILSGSHRMDASGVTSVNGVVFQDLVLRTLLVDWDLGDETKFSNDNLNNLEPEVGRVACSGFLKVQNI